MIWGTDKSAQAIACNCVGPRPGEPLCPCQMRGVIKKDGKWVIPERIIGDVVESHESTKKFLTED